MAVKTLWPVEHACGREEDHDQRGSLEKPVIDNAVESLELGL
jgi:hypothetical protein